MPRRKEEESDSVEKEVQEALKELPEEPKTTKTAPVKVSVVKRPVRRVSFEQWAALRDVKQSHRGGLRAFVQNPSVPRSVEAWDEAFKDY